MQRHSSRSSPGSVSALPGRPRGSSLSPSGWPSSRTSRSWSPAGGEAQGRGPRPARAGSSRGKSLGRELLVALAFATTAAPVALAAGASLAAAATAAGVWSAAFTLQTIAVKGTIAASKGRPEGRARLRVATAGGALLVLLGAWLALRTAVPGRAALAVAPAALHAIALGVRPLPARHLVRVGWSLAAVDLAVAVLLVLWLR